MIGNLSFKLLLCVSLFSIPVIWGCSAAKYQPGSGKGEVAGKDEEFDPLSLEEDDVIQELSRLENSEISDKPLIIPRKLPEPEQPDSLETEMIEFVEVPGWRIQIAATKGFDEAKEIEEKAKDKFGPQVYVQFESTWYKVRVGDCLTSSEVDELMREARKKGYREAFPVRCTVLKPEE